MDRLGLVGLPNSGKSALFNALTGGDAVVASHPFSTIETEVGVAHQLMHENRHPMGNMSILVGARDADQRD